MKVRLIIIKKCANTNLNSERSKMHEEIRCPVLFLVVFLTLMQFDSHAQTTGKIAGTVFDAETGKPLIGANVIVVGTTLGAAVALDGSFYIINLPPGVYTVRVQMMGYAITKVEQVRVSVNRSTTLDFKLKTAVLEAEEVVVVAEKVTMKKDQTSSVRNVTSESIEVLPVENVADIVEMQPGVVRGHFRGGRLSEVSYMIDGIQVDERFVHAGRAVDVEIEVVEEVEVITGTFNAEYGRAMSGIVNAVTKEGRNTFHGSVSLNYANYYTSHKDVFIGLKDSDLDRNKDYKVFFSGPLYRNRLSFVVNGRYQNNLNHFNGIHRFNVDDFSDFSRENSTFWYTEHHGDGSFVAMEKNKNISFFGKLTYRPFNSLRTSLIYTLNNDEWGDYDHSYKYNPYGLASSYRESQMVAFQLNHMLSRSAFYEFKASYVDNYSGDYLFENPTDNGYVHDDYGRDEGTGFYTGGQQKHNKKRTLKDYNAKFDLTWQVNQQHSLKSGLLFTYHDLDNQDAMIRNLYYGTELETVFSYDILAQKRNYLYYEPMLMPNSSVFSDIYTSEPREFSIYIQDKMEFEDMVINLGVRYDYFDPNTVYPSQLRNPANQLYFPDNPEKMSTYPKADPQYQISPRLGISYQLGETALFRFAYGHFFQMPPLYAIYQNYSFLVPPNDYGTTMGNPQIQAQKTIQYEVGLWQQLLSGMNLEVAVFYRDIYDLLSAKVITTYNQIEYGLYSNKDYGNARGLELKYEYIYGPLMAILNYTLQFTRGNADNPMFTFSRAGDNMDPVNRLIPMSWDQRNTLNVSVGYNTSRHGTTVTAYYNSGTPYTWSPISESPLYRVNLFPNNAYKPNQVTVDLNGYYNIMSYRGMKVRLKLLAFNLLDKLNDVRVNNQTGRAYTAIVRESELMSHHSDFNDYDDRIHNPEMYAPPRLVKIGLEFMF